MDDASLFRTAAAALAGDGWCALTGLLAPAQTRALAGECAALHAARQLAPARVGAAHTATELRGDRTQWFDPAAASPPQRAFIARLDALRIALNRELMLGLVECESHYAVYRPGAGYARHLDRLRGTDARVVSAVFYLNENWQETDGGALRLYLEDGTHRDIFPHAGTLLLFLSAQFEHEVLPATRERLSIACWMRQRSLGTAV
ncbi:MULTISPECIES: 2OG-Fe(II) oxygenase [unclassified Rhodanobacter]|uniref:2OG-Fe(II) oxygenase n=1 Tax=unclassified Rhodanobacter TaxID=2621553 RepID=UPI001BDDE827|nr:MULTISPECIES: 2OG-Fe(II) oxygenase [unclassified Rhodanobacter]MBT2144091.1 2OG-Fe(II) oxygenase [Rhodanobacter sp. LX-99]MBT2150242.1 2OG-Fe(II) oxygenase [Rhodanobacter sp. LX-100]